jgi:alkylhydroperoxidase/carboxymuconolactone decarboxylase family protein YurZ
MSERLDRIEKTIEALANETVAIRKITESNAKAIEALANESAVARQEALERDRKLDEKLDRLANIVLRIANRQDDHEDRINRLEEKD